jgi:PPM family protein phosphatase
MANPNILSFGKSDPGLKRSNNEDIFLIRSEMGLDVLADGMGGAAGGEVASQLFAQTVLDVFSKSPGFDEEQGLELLRSSFELANRRILEQVSNNPHLQGMGCTAELLVFFDRRFVIGHVGDSRTYIYRQGRLRQLTKDHSLVQDQVDEGLITPDQARTHRLRNVILRAVGVHDVIAVDFVRGNVARGDIFLLCSDGLTDMMEDGDIEKVLSLPLTIPEKVDKLIESANAAGGRDNVTVVLTEIQD